MYKIMPLYKDAEFGRKIVSHDRQNLSDVNVPEMVKLLNTYGVLYFEGFNTDPSQFEQFAEKFPYNDFLGHGAKSIRPWVQEHGKTTLASQGFNRVYMHPELGYTPVVPDALFFYCVKQSTKSGETLVCDGIEMFKKMPKEMRKLFCEKKINFKSTWKPTFWEGSLRTSDVNEAMKKLRKSPLVRNLRKTEDNSLHFDLIVSAVVKPFHQNEPAFNSSIILMAQHDIPPLMHFSIEFEDGSPISHDMLEELDVLSNKIARPVGWEPGNLAVIENSRFMHGRNAFEGDRVIHVKYGKTPSRESHFEEFSKDYLRKVA